MDLKTLIFSALRRYNNIVKAPEDLNSKGYELSEVGNYAEAVKWYRIAAEQGDADAQFNLGLLYNNGDGVTQNYTEAAKWYHKAAEQGDYDAVKAPKLLENSSLNL